MPNLENLKALRTAILANPQAHQQKYWASLPVDPVTYEPLIEGSCGTTCCMAGTAAQLAGKKIDWDAGTDVRTDEDRTVRVSGLLTDGQYIEGFAMNWLGLGSYEANELFMTMDEREALEVLDKFIDEAEYAALTA